MFSAHIFTISEDFNRRRHLQSSAEKPNFCQRNSSQLSRLAPDLMILKSFHRETALRIYIYLNFWSDKLLLEIILFLLGPLLPKFLNTRAN